MAKYDFKKTLTDHNVFVKKYTGGNSIILLLYVDDMLIVGHVPKKISTLKKAFSKSFAMMNLRSAKEILLEENNSR